MFGWPRGRFLLIERESVGDSWQYINFILSAVWNYISRVLLQQIITSLLSSGGSQAIASGVFVTETRSLASTDVACFVHNWEGRELETWLEVCWNLDIIASAMIFSWLISDSYLENAIWELVLTPWIHLDRLERRRRMRCPYGWLVLSLVFS